MVCLKKGQHERCDDEQKEGDLCVFTIPIAIPGGNVAHHFER